MHVCCPSQPQVTVFIDLSTQELEEPMNLKDFTVDLWSQSQSSLQIKKAFAIVNCLMDVKC